MNLTYNFLFLFWGIKSETLPPEHQRKITYQIFPYIGCKNLIFFILMSYVKNNNNVKVIYVSIGTSISRITAAIKSRSIFITFHQIWGV